MAREDIMCILMDSAVHAAARDGLENTTTRSIGCAAGLPDSYIYRYFRDKNDLLEQAYIRAMQSFYQVILRKIQHLREQERNFEPEQYCRLIWQDVWDFLMENPDICRFCIYYHYSPNYHSLAQEKDTYYRCKMAEILSPEFFNSVEIPLLLDMLFAIMFFMAVQVVDGKLPKNEQTDEMAFNQIYTAISANLKRLHENKECDSQTQ